MLHTLLRSLTPQEVLAQPDAKLLLQALIPYTERHLGRLDTLLTRSFIVDHLLRAMDSLHPLADADAHPAPKRRKHVQGPPPAP